MKKANKYLKFAAVIMALIMMLTLNAFAAGDEKAVLKAYPNASTDAFYAYRTSIVSVTFENSIDTSGAAESWDASLLGDGSVMAWIVLNDAETAESAEDRYDLYFGAQGGVAANESSAHLFSGFTALKEVKGLENFSVKNVKDMSCMFKNCSSLTALDLSTWDTSYLMPGLKEEAEADSSLSESILCAAQMTDMFSGCTALETLDISNFTIPSYKDRYDMFKNCTALKSVDLSDGCVAEGGDLTKLFMNLTALETVDLSSFDSKNSIALHETFADCTSIKKLDMTALDMSNCLSLYCTFYNCTSLSELNVAGWDTSNVTTLYCTFMNCAALKNLDLSSWNTKKVTSMDGTFSGTTALKKIYVGDGWSVNKVTSGTNTFYNCFNLSGKTKYENDKRTQKYATTDYYMSHIIFEKLATTEKVVYNFSMTQGDLLDLSGKISADLIDDNTVFNSKDTKIVSHRVDTKTEVVDGNQVAVTHHSLKAYKAGSVQLAAWAKDGRIIVINVTVADSPDVEEPVEDKTPDIFRRIMEIIQSLIEKIRALFSR